MDLTKEGIKLTRSQCVKITHLWRKGVKDTLIARNVGASLPVVKKYLTIKEAAPVHYENRHSDTYSGVPEEVTRSGWSIIRVGRVAPPITLPRVRFLENKS